MVISMGIIFPVFILLGCGGEARIAQLVKAWICNLRVAGSSPTAGGVFFWYGPLASLSLQIARVGSDHHTKKWKSLPVD